MNISKLRFINLISLVFFILISYKRVLASEDISYDKLDYLEETAQKQEEQPVVSKDGFVQEDVPINEEAYIQKAPMNIYRFPLKIKTNIKSRFFYESNYLKKRHDPKSNLTIQLGPLFTIQNRNPNSMLKLHFNYYFPVINISKNVSNSGLNQDLKGGYKFSRGPYFIKGSDNMRSDNLVATSEQGVGSRVFINEFTNEAGVRFNNRISSALNYRRYDYMYLTKASKQNSYVNNSIGPKVSYHIGNDLEVFLKRMYSFISYPNGGVLDSKGTRTTLGIQTNLARTVLQLESGFQKRVYKDKSRENPSGVFLEGLVSYKIGHRTKLNFSIKKDFQESTVSTVGFYNSLSLSSIINYKFTPRISGQLGYSWQHNTYSEESSEVDSDTLQNFIGKRRYDINTLNSSLSYKFSKKLTLQGGFSTSKRVSNFKNSEYLDNTYTITSNYEF